MKIFVYNGSNRGKASLGEVYANTLNNLMKKTSDIQFYYHSAKNTEIKTCMGCRNCFDQLNCHLNDDMEQLKTEMINSDVIILISPVFFHSVSGSMKNFIDRITYWSHSMRLIGKVGVVVSVSDGNGNEFVNGYLKKVLMYLGVSIIDEVSIRLLRLSTTTFDEFALNSKKIITKAIKDEQFVFTEFQEMIFKYYKIAYSNLEINTNEAKFWRQSGLSEYNTFQEAFVHEYAKKHIKS